MRIICGEFCLDTALREIRGPHGLMHAEPRVFDLLVHLMTNSERVVTRPELIAAVWGGRTVSDSALAFQLNAARSLLGDNGVRQALIRTVPRKGVRFVGKARIEGVASVGLSQSGYPEPRLPSPLPQEIHYCKATDGVRIAYAASGRGVALVRTPTWFNHIEHDWRNPLRAPLLHALRPYCHQVRYDGRGTGMSDRSCADLTFEGFLRDTSAVVDALALRRYGMLGISSGGAVALAHAARFPEKVSFLILHGAYGRGRNQRGSPRDANAAVAFDAMLRAGWGDDQSAFLRAFSSVFIPGGTPQQISSLAAMQRAATTGEIAVRLRQTNDDINIESLLPRITVPTLILHCTGDQTLPFAESERLASRIANARLISLPSSNHIPLPDEPAWAQFIGEIINFIHEHGGSGED